MAIDDETISFEEGVRRLQELMESRVATAQASVRQWFDDQAAEVRDSIESALVEEVDVESSDDEEEDEDEEVKITGEFSEAEIQMFIEQGGNLAIAVDWSEGSLDDAIAKVFAAPALDRPQLLSALIDDHCVAGDDLDTNAILYDRHVFLALLAATSEFQAGERFVQHRLCFEVLASARILGQVLERGKMESSLILVAEPILAAVDDQVDIPFWLPLALNHRVMDLYVRCFKVLQKALALESTRARAMLVASSSLEMAQAVQPLLASLVGDGAPHDGRSSASALRTMIAPALPPPE